ncbi:YceI family protein [Dyadobacter subterraneus]|uniref:YceI family protein n=1 Tax=Dyadobacter subterraneus TaxID=2773304 RepID=A0ABR9WD17_9BACT|nr:YceI family protein [Dyadobacter subterraneus]MBE9463373.1 YceI family protein [Dyadobacter subterraneus]
MATTKWIADPETSEVLFNASHLLLDNVTGYFRKIKLEVATEDDDFTRFYGIVFTADINSLDTADQQRDEFLKSNIFFDEEQFGQLKFVGKKYENQQDEDKLCGSLTIRNVTKPISLQIEFSGKIVEPDGNTKVGFSAQGKISRKDYDLTCHSISELRILAIGDEIRFNAEIQLIKIL